MEEEEEKIIMIHNKSHISHWYADLGYHDYYYYYNYYYY